MLRLFPSSAPDPNAGFGTGHTATDATWRIALLALVLIGADTLSFPFFADDFHFLDVARHHPVLDLLTGRYGIWPWYRPLSRELFFLVASRAGPLGALVTHALLLICVSVSAALIYAIAMSAHSQRAGAVAAILFLSYEATKMLASWASGFQDLLALALLLGAIRLLQTRHLRASILVAMLAPLAKESGFVVYPIGVMYLVLSGAFRGQQRTTYLFAVTSVIPVSLHVIARLSWHYTASPIVPADGASHIVSFPPASGSDWRQP